MSILSSSPARVHCNPVRKSRNQAARQGREPRRFLPARFRHATAVRVAGRPTVVEFWTFAEFEELDREDRPDSVYIIPGLGWCSFREPQEGEVAAIRDECQRASDREWAERMRRGRV